MRERVEAKGAEGGKRSWGLGSSKAEDRRYRSIGPIPVPIPGGNGDPGVVGRDPAARAAVSSLVTRETRNAEARLAAWAPCEVEIIDSGRISGGAILPVDETGEVGVEELATAEGPQMLEDRRGSVIAAPGLGGVGGLDDIKSQIGEI
jgi:hypothetical protein